MGALLKVAGFQPFSATSATTALSLAAQLGDDLDVLIVDYHLEDADLTGTDVAECVTRSLGCSVPTIVLTGDPANAEIPLLPKSPVWLMSKPADPDLLTASLVPLVELNRVVRRIATRGRKPR